jgi:hypothetical protein
LVPCTITSSAKVEQLFIIERGAPGVRGLDHEATLARLIENTDDAYGFPPFKYLAPSITIGGLGYQQLREREREILASFLSRVTTRVVASDSFGWADEIPKLLRGEQAESQDSTLDLADARRCTSAGIWPQWDTRLVRRTA